MSKCIGCGVILQNDDSGKDGYVADIKHNLCLRCFMIKNYGKNSDVLSDNTVYSKILTDIKKDDLVVYVASLSTLNLDFINQFENVILVLTKRDILPKSIKDGKIINYIRNRYNNILDIVVVSAYKKFNLDELYVKLNKYGVGKQIYFVGMTNSGKSTLINAMIKSYNGYDGEITTSNFPATTQDVVSVKIGNLVINDTPGIMIEDSIINKMDDGWIKKINSKKEIKPITFQIKGSGAILLDELVRVEYNTDESSATFYVSNNLNISSINMNNPRLKDGNILEYFLDDNQDIVIEDVGFIKFTKSVRIRLIYKDKLHVSVRDNLI